MRTGATSQMRADLWLRVDCHIVWEKTMKVLFAVVGALIGLLLVRSFMLDTFEEIGWRMFWDALFKGNISTKA